MPVHPLRRNKCARLCPKLEFIYRKELSGRGDLNPRPETRNLRYYMFRLVFNLMGVQPTARQPAHDSAKFDCLAADALNSGSVKMPLNLNVQTHSSERQRELSR